MEARDAAGNWSSDGPSVTVKTLPKDAPAPETEAPTWAPGSSRSAGCSGQLVIEWTFGDGDDAALVSRSSIEP
ncbi:hypothetical protein ACFSWD_20890 [Paenibacillus xanthanilyticus]